jgi:hypothetical protein
MPRLKRWLNVPAELESVHTAKVGNYFIEGHVPAEDIKLLLKEKPKARGLAVPGLPRGARDAKCPIPSAKPPAPSSTTPARSAKSGARRYNTLLVGPDGKTSIFARH